MFKDLETQTRTNRPRPSLYILAGFSGSGKSTLLNFCQDIPGFIPVGRLCKEINAPKVTQGCIISGGRVST